MKGERTASNMMEFLAHKCTDEFTVYHRWGAWHVSVRDDDGFRSIQGADLLITLARMVDMVEEKKP